VVSVVLIATSPSDVHEYDNIGADVHLRTSGAISAASCGDTPPTRALLSGVPQAAKKLLRTMHATTLAALTI
jgi:hypothetical protein